MKRTWVVRVGVAAMAAGMCLMGMAAEGQVVSPPPNPQLPPPAPLAGVRYDYPWEIYGGFAYSHFDAGPKLLQGANLGGFDARAVREFGTTVGRGRERARLLRDDRRFAELRELHRERAECGADHRTVCERAYVFGGSGISAGRNEHAAMMLHAFVGGAYGNFTERAGRGESGVAGVLLESAHSGGGDGWVDRSEPVAAAGVPDRARCDVDGLWAQRICGAVRDFGGCGVSDGTPVQEVTRGIRV